MCATPDCNNEAKLRCPNCVKLDIFKESFFCGKECFKNFWSKHRDIHNERKIK